MGGSPNKSNRKESGRKRDSSGKFTGNKGGGKKKSK